MIDAADQPKASVAFPPKWYRLAIAVASLACYAISFFLPAATFQQGDKLDTWVGWNCAMTSMLGFLLGQFNFFANLFYIASLAVFGVGKWKWSAGVSFVALLFVAETLTLYWTPIPANEGDVGPRYVLKCFESGFYLWGGSMLMILVASVFAELRKKS